MVAKAILRRPLISDWRVRLTQYRGDALARALIFAVINRELGESECVVGTVVRASKHLPPSPYLGLGVRDDGVRGKRYVVTGAASGIGQAVATQLIADGAEVISLDRNTPRIAVSSHVEVDLANPRQHRCGTGTVGR